MNDPIRWGILAPGRIARKFAEGLKEAEGAQLVGVGSRDLARAREFGARFGSPRAYGSYEELVADSEIDAVYVASPHPFHAEHSILALDAGKAVLCEKPFALNARQARKVVETARTRGVFCMEAMWTRFIPTMVRLRELLAEGVIGEVKMLVADFGFGAAVDPAGRLFNPKLGGGALLDVGIYPVSLASMVLGTPERITGLTHLGGAGVDEQGAVVFGYPSGAVAVCYTAIRVTTPQLGYLMGSRGRIELDQGWWNGRSFVVKLEGETRTVQPYRKGNGYNYEAEEVGRCLREGRTESAVMSLDETVSIMETLDRIRAQWGLRYPGE